MNGDELRAIQAPLKDRYRSDAKAGLVTLKANGALDSAGKPLPGLAPVAKQQGVYVARRLRALIRGRKLPGPFRYRGWGTMATIGRGDAVLRRRQREGMSTACHTRARPGHRGPCRGRACGARRRSPGRRKRVEDSEGQRRCAATVHCGSLP